MKNVDPRLQREVVRQMASMARNAKRDALADIAECYREIERIKRRRHGEAFEEVGE